MLPGGPVPSSAPKKKVTLLIVVGPCQNQNSTKTTYSADRHGSKSRVAGFYSAVPASWVAPVWASDCRLRCSCRRRRPLGPRHSGRCAAAMDRRRRRLVTMRHCCQTSTLCQSSLFAVLRGGYK